MTIWILSVVLLASLAGMGYRQGAIRVAFSFVGIVLGGLLAAPLGNLITPLFAAAGLKHPVWLWAIPPLLVFAVILTLFKVAAAIVHKRVEVHYKYNAGDLRLALWERLNQRVGLSLGIANGAAYLILISLLIYMTSYWTYQLSAGEADPTAYKLVNRLGKDLQSTGMTKVAAAVDQSSPAFYDGADVSGLIYKTPQLQQRLFGYPAFLSVAERQPLQEFLYDQDLAALRRNGAPLAEIVHHHRSQTILNNPELMAEIKQALSPHLEDLETYLETGHSPKFGGEPILGRWNFDLDGAIALLRKEKPTIPSSQMMQMRRYLAGTFARASLVATPNNEVFLKNVPRPTGGPTVELQTLQGQWKKTGGNYQITINADGQQLQLSAEVQGARLNVTGLGTSLAFARQ